MSDHAFKRTGKFPNPTPPRSDFGNALAANESSIFVADRFDRFFDSGTGTVTNGVGAVYTYDRFSGSVSAINPPEAKAGIRFGSSLALGEYTLAIGEFAKRIGRVHLFDPTFGDHLLTIESATGAASGEFYRVVPTGADVAVGSTINGTKDRGAIYVYAANPNLPNFGQLRVKFDPPKDNRTSVFRDDDGFTAYDNLIIIGQRDVSLSVPKEGRILLYENNPTSPKYGTLLKIIDNPDPQFAFYSFGRTVVASSGWLFVSYRAGDSKSNGRVYVYDIRRASSRFGEIVDLVELPKSNAPEKGFGASIAITNELLIIGSPSSSKTPSGSEIEVWGNVYLFPIDLSTGKVGNLSGALDHDESDGKFSNFGRTLFAHDGAIYVSSYIKNFGGCVYLYSNEPDLLGDEKYRYVTPIQRPISRNQLSRAAETGDIVKLERSIFAKDRLSPLPDLVETNSEDVYANNIKPPKKKALSSVRGLSPSAEQAFKNAIKIYRELSANPSGNIKLNNGRRSSAEQARLYRGFIGYKFYGDPVKFNDANMPGRSFHEYGFAIDVIRGADEANIAKALKQAKWDDPHEDEGWHWEAKNAEGYLKAKQKMDVALTHSKRYAAHVSNYFQARKTKRELELKFTSDRALLRRELERLKRDDRRLKRLFEELRKDKEELDGERKSLNRLKVKLDRKRGQLEKFMYTYCPNRRAYARCNHVTRKARYDAERRAMEEELSKGVKQHKRLMVVYSSSLNAWQNDRKKLQSRKREVDARKSKFRRSKTLLEKLSIRIKKLQQRMIDQKAKEEEVLVVISRITG